MNPKIWGKPGWTFLHLITCEYPENPTIEEKTNYRLFFSQAQYVLPCGKCRRHYQINLASMPLSDQVMQSRLSLMIWLINMHNLVNKQTGKKVLTYTEALNAIKKMTEKKKANPWMIGGSVLIIILLIIIFILILKRND
jgi:hypothetical protein